MANPRPYPPNYYRVIKVILPERTYHTVQVDEGDPWGPIGSTLEVKHSQLSLSRAEEVRDFCNGLHYK